MKKLWVRKYSCGHERHTNLAFMFGVYLKPKVGNKGYCGICCKHKEIISVKEADEKDTEELKRTIIIENLK